MKACVTYANQNSFIKEHDFVLLQPHCTRHNVELSTLEGRLCLRESKQKVKITCKEHVPNVKNT